MHVVSGGQTGADQGGLLAAEALGIPTGGWVPRGWRTDAGSAPWLGTRFGLREHASPGYPERTVANVAEADAVLVFGNAGSAGCTLTLRAARRYQRPVFLARWPGQLDVVEFRAWAAKQRAASDLWTLDVAGNRERTNPGIQLACATFVYEGLRV